MASTPRRAPHQLFACTLTSSPADSQDSNDEPLEDGGYAFTGELRAVRGNWKIAAEFIDNGDGTYDGSYTMPTVDPNGSNYILKIMSTDGRQNVVGSPFNIRSAVAPPPTRELSAPQLAILCAGA